MTEFNLRFDFSRFETLDQFALLACQDYNLGNRGDWFGCFRGGLYGLHARLYGVHVHYATVHAWLPRRRSPGETEYHLLSIMFSMDSAVECLVFALNSLGNAVAPDAFFNVADAGALRQVAPRNIIGTVDRKNPRPGYARFFPKLASYWETKRDLLDRIVEQHDVSKHRSTIFVGGRARLDPPVGFYESLGVPDEASARADYWPMAEIILELDPKVPRADRRPSGPSGAGLLEDLANEFCDFMNTSGRKALDDAVATIILREQEFRTK